MLPYKQEVACSSQAPPTLDLRADPPARAALPTQNVGHEPGRRAFPAGPQRARRARSVAPHRGSGKQNVRLAPREIVRSVVGQPVARYQSHIGVGGCQLSERSILPVGSRRR
jgi:hypothetical protein